ncbi:MAG: efflux RND transporter periplasmic adaptor subunit [Chloroflexi bacterium]|nr:efflux RND transporter periplasmic adaptor subunit [Chloroflexota bacterium]
MKFNFPFTRRQGLIGIGVLIGLIVLGVLGFVFMMPQAPPPNSVIVRRGDLSASVNATGRVRAKKSLRLVLPVSGIVATIEKYEGDEVNQGDVIVTLTSEEVQRRLKQAELNFNSRQLDISRAKSAPRDEDIEIARANLRKATLYAAAAETNNNASPTPQNAIALESARNDLDVARASFNRVVNGPSKEELQALDNSLTLAQMDLDAAKQLAAQTKLLAPFNGTITEVNVRVGEYVGGFSQLAAMADLTALEIAADVDEIDVAHVQVGQNVEVRLDAFPGERFAGKVMRLFPAASAQRGSTSYSAIVDFDPRDIKVRVGMGAPLKIQTIEKKGVLTVPNRALKNIGTRKAVRIIAPGAPRDALVETGLSDGANTEIVSGVNEGDLVVIN